MFVLFCLLAAATAAPHYSSRRWYHPEDPAFSLSLNDEIFDTRRFWADLATEMRQLDAMLTDFYAKFPAMQSTERVVGNTYQITIPLSGFNEKDIIVKAREGMLMVQAVQKLENGGERSYLDIKTLPSMVNVTGTWEFDKEVLNITFPLKEEALTTVPPATDREIPVTESAFTENRSREVMERHDNDDNDADVGLTVVGPSKDRELFTNEIPRGDRVEATTYAVDLKDEVEFVPVRY